MADLRPFLPRQPFSGLMQEPHPGPIRRRLGVNANRQILPPRRPVGRWPGSSGLGTAALGLR